MKFDVLFFLEIYNKYKIFTPEWFLYLGDLDLLDEGLERRISYAILVATKPSGRQQLAKKAVHYGLHELNYCDGKLILITNMYIHNYLRLSIMWM